MPIRSTMISGFLLIALSIIPALSAENWENHLLLVSSAGGVSEADKVGVRDCISHDVTDVEIGMSKFGVSFAPSSERDIAIVAALVEQCLRRHPHLDGVHVYPAPRGVITDWSKIPPPPK